MKIVLNRCYGGFSLSKLAVERMADLGSELAIVALRENHCGPSGKSFYFEKLKRNDEILIQVIEELGAAANGECAKLVVKNLDIDDLVENMIVEHDGMEKFKFEI